jgi:preprotein translocase subunit SecA
MMSQLNLRSRLAEACLSLEEMAKVPPVDDQFYPTETPQALDQNLASAVNAVAESEVGQGVETFLQLEELVATMGGEAPFAESPSKAALTELRKVYGELKKLYKDALAEEKDAVIKAGGLYVLGTTRHESRRIDNQLRGRSGRQGDPGTTRFFISLKDDVFRVFGGNKIGDLMDRFRLGDEIPLQSEIVNETLDKVQKAVEEFFKKTRSTLFDFDRVISKQRELTYKSRKDFLANTDETVMKLIREWGDEAVKFHMELVKDKTMEEKTTEYKEYFGLELPNLDGMEPEEVEATLNTAVQKGIEEKRVFYEDFRPGFAVEASRIATVVTIDDEWKILLQKMDALKQTVGLSAYKGTEPLKEYQVQGFRMYQKAENKYKARSVSRWLRSKPKKNTEQAKD